MKSVNFTQPSAAVCCYPYCETHCGSNEHTFEAKELWYKNTLWEVPGIKYAKDFSLLFTNASQTDVHGQLRCIMVLLIDLSREIKLYFHIVAFLNKSNCPVKNGSPDEIPPASEWNDLLEKEATCYSKPLNLFISIHLVVDSRDLFSIIFTQESFADRPIRGSVDFIQFEFSTSARIYILWIPDYCNLADILSKPNSLLTETFQLIPLSGKAIKISVGCIVETRMWHKKFWIKREK